jgi:hypothetical protein
MAEEGARITFTVEGGPSRAGPENADAPCAAAGRSLMLRGRSETMPDYALRPILLVEKGKPHLAVASGRFLVSLGR